MSKETRNQILGIVLSIIVIGVLVKLIKGLMDSTKTEVISEKGINALNDPEKKRKIDDAFEKAAQRQKETGVWVNPEVDLR